MTKFNFIKKLKFTGKRFKFFILSLFAILILIPFLVFAFDDLGVGSFDKGYPKLKNNLSDLIPVYWNTNNETELSKMQVSAGACIINNSNNDYFVPTRTFNEWSAFTSKMNSLLMTLTNGAGLPNNSCMNGTCVPPAETCDNNPVECGNCAFTCGDSLAYNGVNYTTIAAGSQCWFSKNLLYGTMGHTLTSQSNNSSVEYYCTNNDSANCSPYGGLYQWAEAVQLPASCNNYNCVGNATNVCCASYTSRQGICPTGWHVPDYTEYQNLLAYIDSDPGFLDNFQADGASWNWGGYFTGPNPPAGVNANVFIGNGVNTLVVFWTARPWGSASPYTNSKIFDATTLNVSSDWDRESALPVRCVKN